MAQLTKAEKQARTSARQQARQRKEFERIKFAYMIQQLSQERWVEGMTNCFRVKLPASEIFKLAKKKVSFYPADEPPYVSYVVTIED
jgi:hypothetical protein